MIMVVIPVFVAYRLFRWVDRPTEQLFFIFILVTGLGAGLSIVVLGTVADRACRAGLSGRSF